MYLKNPQMFTRLGGKLPRGLMLTGPPGTGDQSKKRTRALDYLDGCSGFLFQREAWRWPRELLGLLHGRRVMMRALSA